MPICEWCHTGFSSQSRGPLRYCSRKCNKQAAAKRKQERHRSIRLTVWKVLPCLKCEQVFKSYGPGNRLCDQCRRENSKIDWLYARFV